MSALLLLVSFIATVIFILYFFSYVLVFACKSCNFVCFWSFAFTLPLSAAPYCAHFYLKLTTSLPPSSTCWLLLYLVRYHSFFKLLTAHFRHIQSTELQTPFQALLHDEANRTASNTELQARLHDKANRIDPSTELSPEPCARLCSKPCSILMPCLSPVSS